MRSRPSSVDDGSRQPSQFVPAEVAQHVAYRRLVRSHASGLVAAALTVVIALLWQGAVRAAEDWAETWAETINADCFQRTLGKAKNEWVRTTSSKFFVEYRDCTLSAVEVGLLFIEGVTSDTLQKAESAAKRQELSKRSTQLSTIESRIEELLSGRHPYMTAVVTGSVPPVVSNCSDLRQCWDLNTMAEEVGKANEEDRNAILQRISGIRKLFAPTDGEPLNCRVFQTEYGYTCECERGKPTSEACCAAPGADEFYRQMLCN